MSRLSVRLNLAKNVLKELNKQPLCRTNLENKIIRSSGRHGSHGAFNSILSYLVQNGYMQKQEQKLRSNYMLTEKGKKLLEAL